VWITIRASGAATPLVPGEADGTLSVDVPSGEMLIAWNGAPGTGKTNRVVVKSVSPATPPPPVVPPVVPPALSPRATIGAIVQHGTSKRIEADRRLAQRLPALRFVTSDFDAATGKLQRTVPSASPERAEIAWLRAANTGAYIVACAMNLWNGRSYAPITPQEARDWAWLALDTWGSDVDCVLGPNEADTAKYNADVRARPADALKHLHELWAEAAQVFRAAGLRVGGPAHLKPESMRLWERDFGALTDVVTCHGYMDRRAAFAQEMRALADAKPDGGLVVVDEIAPTPVLVNGQVDAAATAQACAKLLADWSPYCDVLLHYTGRSEAAELQYDYVALLKQDGTPTPVAGVLQPVFDAAPRRARTTIPIDTQVLLAVAEARRAEGLPALKPSAQLAQQARNIATYVSNLGRDKQIDADFLRQASAAAIATTTTTATTAANAANATAAPTAAVIPSIGGASIATRLSPQVVREDALAWRTSPTHRPIVLSESATEVGVAVVVGTSRYGDATIPTAYFWACIR
jgi:uncharacterized protein YkwD